MKHEYYEILVSRNKDNDLDENEKRELKEHLCKCKECLCFNSKINRMSSLINREELPVVIAVGKENKKHAFNFNQKYIFSLAACMLVFVGVAVFLNNKTPKNMTMTGDNIVAKADNSNTDIKKYQVNKTDYDAPLSIFFDYEEDTNVYSSRPLETFMVYSLSDTVSLQK